jgi:hypothetical protein
MDPIFTHASPSKPMMIASTSPKHSPLHDSPTLSSPRLRMPSSPFLKSHQSGSSPSSLTVGGPPFSTSPSFFRLQNNQGNPSRLFGNPKGLFPGSSKVSMLNQTSYVRIKEEPLQVGFYFFFTV